MENQTANLLLKDVSEIYGRLFNHHPAISAEIQYILKEFQEQRNEDGMHMLFKLLESATEINETQINTIKTQAQTPLHLVSEEFDRALSLSDKILGDAKEMQSHCAKSLIDCRQSRTLEWTDFMMEVAKHKAKIDNDFDEKEMELKSHFQMLLEKLEQSKHQSSTN